MNNRFNLKFASGLSFIVMEAFLAGCGGGGAGGSDNSGGGTPETMSLAPSALETVGSNSAVSLTITGGTAPYAVFTNNSLVQPGPVSSNRTTLTIGCTDADVSATITVLDSKGAVATSTISVKDHDTSASCTSGLPSALAISPPSYDVLSQATGLKLTISGGTAPYSMYSNNALVSALPVSGDQSSLTIGCTDTKQTTVVTVVDSKGASATSSIIINDDAGSTCSTGTSPVAISPSSLSLVGLTSGSNLTISGGTSPYDMYTNNSLVNPAAVASGKSALTIGCTDETQTALITVVDSNGFSSTASVIVSDHNTSSGCSSAATPLSMLPLSLNVLGGEQNAYITISGGTGPYTILSTSQLVSPSSLSGGKSTLTVGCTDSLTPINAIITVLDSEGKSATSTVSVSDNDESVNCIGNSQLAIAPGTLSVQGNQSGVELTVSGGAGSYSIFSNNSVLVPGPVINGKTAISIACTDSDQVATVTVVDSLGATATTTVNVSDSDIVNPCVPSSIPLTVAPSGIASVPVGQPVQMMIYGGVPPYTITSTNTAVGTVTGSLGSSGGFITFSPLSQGSTSLIVRDSASTVQAIGMTTTQPGGSVLNVLPTSVTWSGVCNGAVAYTDFVVSGGIEPYTAFTTAQSIATVAAAATNAEGYTYFRVSEACSGASGNATIVIRDNVGAQISAAFEYEP